MIAVVHARKGGLGRTMKGYDAARHKRTRGVAEAQDHVHELLSSMLDPDNDPTAVFPLVVDGLVTLWHERMMEETGWRDADASPV